MTYFTSIEKLTKSYHTYFGNYKKTTSMTKKNHNDDVLLIQWHLRVLFSETEFQTIIFILGWDDCTFILNYPEDTIYASQLSFSSIMKNIIPYDWYGQILKEKSLDQSKIASVVGVISDYNTNIITLKNHILQKNTLNRLFIRVVDSKLEYRDLNYNITFSNLL